MKLSINDFNFLGEGYVGLKLRNINVFLQGLLPKEHNQVGIFDGI